MECLVITFSIGYFQKYDPPLYLNSPKFGLCCGVPLFSKRFEYFQRLLIVTSHQLHMLGSHHQMSQRQESWGKPIQGWKTEGWQKNVLPSGCEFSSGFLPASGECLIIDLWPEVSIISEGPFHQYNFGDSAEQTRHNIFIM